MPIDGKVEASTINHAHLTTLGSCSSNMDEIYIFKANGIEVYVVVIGDWLPS